MAKTTERLSALKVANLKGPGYFADGGNLYFRIASGGGGGWIFRFTMAGRTRDMGLGGYPEISLAAARKAAARYRELVKQGVDPIEQRRTDRAAQRTAAAKALTFDQCAAEYMADHEGGWRNGKHRDQWRTSLRDYVSPVFGRLPVAAVDDGLVMRALKPIWHAKPETASRVRGRVESILDWARVRGYRSGENPARWKGHLDHLLSPVSKLRLVQHHAALPYPEIASFMTALREQQGNAPRALEFLILTAGRSGEVLGATWDEIDLVGKTWTVPAERMKGGRPHRVPLSDAALRIIEAQPRTGNLVFPGTKLDRPLSGMSLPLVLQRMGRRDVTVHGFRSSFRDWVGEATQFPREVAEAALAHLVGNSVERAYARGDALEKRRALMDAWAAYCGGRAAGKVVALRRR